jgi:carboxyl-terminal processing protease
VRRTAVLAVALAALVAFGTGLALRPVAHGSARRPPRGSEVRAVRAELAARYYRNLPAAVLAKPSVSTLIASLHDRYTAYLTPAEYRSAHRAYVGGYGGIGVLVLPGSGGLLVRRTVKGPARIAGIKSGDTILAVDGANTAGLTFQGAIGRILGRAGSHVSLRVLRAGHTLEFRLVRQHFRLQPVHARLNGHVGVIRIAAFSRGAARSTTSAVKQLQRRGATSLVLDLRGDPGGLLNEAVGVASLFLRGGSTIVSLAGAHRPLEIVYARPGGPTTIPLAVLVDSGSASASEVVAGALKDHGRASIIGEPTYGKSLVQEVVQLPSGAALKLTVARYLTPAGVDISRNGVQPDIRSRHALDAALRLFTARRRS